MCATRSGQATRRRLPADERRYDRSVSGHELTTLPGGERVISERIDGVRSIALGLWIGVGSRDETNTKAGLSHFIEHLVFKGSKRYDALRIAQLFDTMGGELNAATSRDTTVVYTRIPDDHLEQAVDAMAEMVFSPTFADLDNEREVILEEIAMVEDNPQDLVHDLAAQAVFGAHPIGRPVIGYADVISRVTRRTIAAYHAASYVGPNVVLAAAGNVDHDRLAGLLAARRPKRPGKLGIERKAVARIGKPSLQFLRKRTEQYHVVLAGPGISRADPRRYASSVLDAILGGSASSRLFQEIREKRGMAYSVYSYGSQYDETGQVGIYVGTREDNVAECLAIAAGEIHAIAQGRLKPDEIARAKENIKGRLLLSLESTSARMTRIGRAVITGTEIVSIEETISRIEEVTEQDVAELAASTYAPERLSAAGIGPSEKRFRAAVSRFNPELTG
jgi:predicted Zn-dependent peptidase